MGIVLADRHPLASKPVGVLVTLSQRENVLFPSPRGSTDWVAFRKPRDFSVLQAFAYQQLCLASPRLRMNTILLLSLRFLVSKILAVFKRSMVATLLSLASRFLDIRERFQESKGPTSSAWRPNIRTC